MSIQGQMHVRIWDVEHGACAMIQHVQGTRGGRLAMIDSGDNPGFSPSTYIKKTLGRTYLDFLFITNADQDHMSALHGLREDGISVGALYRNPSYTGMQFREIKRQAGPLTNDAERYAALCDQNKRPNPHPFNEHMGGIFQTNFYNRYPLFTNANDLSLVIFVKFAGFKILFPGDLEMAGWTSLLKSQEFRDELKFTDILVASHHGRKNGFCPEVFDYCKPSAVVISDKPVAHETQAPVPDYRAVVAEAGVPVRTTSKRRHVLTTRRDGWIQFTVGRGGYYFVDTEFPG